MKVEIWSDVACPWCFIGQRRFHTALDGFEHRDEVEVQWRSYQLDPSLPDHFDGTEAEYLSQSKGMPIDQVKQMFTQVSSQAAGEGLNFDFDRVVVANSFTAHRFLHLAKAHGVMDRAKVALLSGHFEHGRDIGDHDYLVVVGTELGIAATEIRSTLDSDEFTTEVHSDIAEARALGVNGVPFFVIDRKFGISGAQPPAAFAEALETAWSQRSPLTVLSGGPGDEYPDGATCGPEGCD